MSTIRRRRTPIVLGVFALTVVACQVVAGIERVQKTSPGIGVGDGGSSSGGEGGAEGGGNEPDECAHVHPNPLPEKDDDPNTIIPSFYVAVRTISVTNPNGFDLDGVCTCDKRKTFRNGESTCKPVANNSPCDEDGGVDNKGASLFGQFTNSGVNVDESITQDITEGKKDLLIHVAGWNGKPNDRDVSVGILAGASLAVGAGGCSPDDGAPHWCGHDKWNYAEKTTVAIKGEVVPLYRANGAYVSNGQLVFTKKESATLFFGVAALTLGSPVMAGTLEPAAGGGFKLTGTLSGRIPVDELLGAIGQFKSPFGGGFICEQQQVMDTAKKLVCPAVDIAKTDVDDTQNVPCSSISASLSFVAEPADLGAEVVPPTENNACLPSLPANQGKYVCP